MLSSRRRRLWPALLLSGWASVVGAAAPAADFVMAPAQLQALGVGVQKLVAAVPAVAAPAPAKVVLPPELDTWVSAPVDGVVTQVLVNPQDTVKPGQPLLRLASPALGEMQLRLMEAGSRLQLAQQTLERERRLLDEGIVPARRVQEADAAHRSALAGQRQAEAALRLAGLGDDAVQRVAAGGRMQDGVTVSARMAGWVTALEVRPGQRVREADALVRIANPREVWLEVQLPVGSPVTPGQAVTVLGRDVTAVAQALGPLVSEGQTQTLRVRVTRGAALLRPGEVLQVAVPRAAGNSWALPQAAVVHHEGRAHVFVRTARGFSAVPVVVSAGAAGVMQVSGNLQAGQEVAVRSVVAIKSAWLGHGGGE
ncbi:efflux RND transporter periplasmic adaptor subunit [Roseateles sp. BYS87W]|uniref:Efflux RND transporter periplasmic adaptor subunit n=1 Tax=Pelomonas baiyunensis TaxID=3299026 RepID=A0ABW7H1S1_9BURK